MVVKVGPWCRFVNYIYALVNFERQVGQEWANGLTGLMPRAMTLLPTSCAALG